jgi:hypothetical protein
MIEIRSPIVAPMVRTHLAVVEPLSIRVRVRERLPASRQVVVVEVRVSRRRTLRLSRHRSPPWPARSGVAAP